MFNITKDIRQLLIKKYIVNLLVQERINLVNVDRYAMEDRHKKMHHVKNNPELQNWFDRNDDTSLVCTETADNIWNILFPTK